MKNLAFQPKKANLHGPLIIIQMQKSSFLPTGDQGTFPAAHDVVTAVSEREVM